MKSDRTKIFISYSHKDKKWLEQLRPHLGSLAREHGFDIWDDTRIKSGSKWREDIKSTLASFKVAILLISKFFLDSDFILNEELPEILKASELEGAVILQIIAGPCRIEDHPALSHFQYINPPSKTLAHMSGVEREELFVALAKRIEEILGESVDTVSQKVASQNIPGKAIQQFDRVRKGEVSVTIGEGPIAKKPVAVSEPEILDTAQLGPWQRVLVQANDQGELHYQVVGSREKYILVARQRLLVDRLVDGCIRNTHFDPNTSRTLFELLVPNQLKDTLFSSEGCVLILDEDSARYPWELMLNNRTTNDKPFAVQCKIIRQLPHNYSTSISRQGPHCALVIGDPISTFPELPGAQIEAHEIASMLREFGFGVSEHIRPTSVDAIMALVSQPYQVLHVTGHGVVNYALSSNERVTGIVLGDDIFFTAVEAAQIREIPDLVFINCSHLGQIAAKGIRDVDRLAANLARQFLTMGARILVGPGWAIDDMAAIEFAKTFYAAMLKGDCFADAVFSARKRIYQQHPMSNTWGAYHCYGDPEFRLI